MSSLGLPRVKKTLRYRCDSSGGHQTSEGAGACDMGGQAERAGSVQLRNRRLGGYYCSL